MHTKVSIIVPIYNVGDYLQRCVDSLLSQTHKNIEILLVDDGSTDNSPYLCDKYAEEDSRVRVFHKENGGAAQSRNYVLGEVTGEYITMVDSDDRVAHNYIEQLLTAAVESGADIAVCGYYLEYEDGSMRKRTNYDGHTQTYNAKDAIRDHLLEDSVLEPVFWNKIYKTKLLIDNAIIMPEGDIYEDSRTLYRIYYYANKLVYTRVPLYYYLQRQGSVMNDAYKKRNLELLNIVPAEAEKWLELKAPNEYTDALFSYKLTGRMNTINYMVDRNNIDIKVWRKNSKYIRNNIFKIINAKYITLKRKIACISVLSGVRLYCFIRKKYIG